MKLREHFLLGTDQATISVTARGDETRQNLFAHSLNAILTRYAEEFGKEAAVELLENLRKEAIQTASEMNWRLRDEDSCWTEAKRQLTRPEK